MKFVEEEVSELYNQDNTVPIYDPIWINNHLYIFGYQHGVVLYQRGSNDPHIMIGIIGEDYGYWFETDSLGSSYWLEDFKHVISILEKWLKDNAIKGKWGYNFKNR